MPNEAKPNTISIINMLAKAGRFIKLTTVSFQPYIQFLVKNRDGTFLITTTKGSKVCYIKRDQNVANSYKQVKKDIADSTIVKYQNIFTSLSNIPYHGKAKDTDR